MFTIDSFGLGHINGNKKYVFQNLPFIFFFLLFRMVRKNIVDHLTRIHYHCFFKYIHSEW